MDHSEIFDCNCQLDEYTAAQILTVITGDQHCGDGAKNCEEYARQE